MLFLFYQTMKHATIRDVARLAGVSRATVTRAFDGFDNSSIKPATQKRVLEVAAQLDYRPNPAAQQLKSRKSRAVCLPIVQIFRSRTGAGPISFQLGDMLSGAGSLLQAVGYRLEPVFFRTEEEARAELPQLFRACYFDAIIFPVDAEWAWEAAKGLTSVGCLVVVNKPEGRPVKNLIRAFVPRSFNDVVLQELIRQGKKRILLQAPLEQTASIELRKSPALVKINFELIPTGLDEQGGIKPSDLAQWILDKQPKADAIVLLDEFYGWELFKCLQALDVEVPERMTIAGAGDVRHPLKPLPILQLNYAPAALTMREMTRKLVETLIELKLCNAQTEVLRPVHFPAPRLLVLSSKDFKTAAARELREEALLAEVEAEVTQMTGRMQGA